MRLIRAKSRQLTTTSSLTAARERLWVNMKSYVWAAAAEANR
jgi:hypothetical protein